MLTQDEWQAVRLSLVVSAVAVSVALPIAIGIGWVMAKKNFFGKQLIEGLINLPMVLPPVVTGYLIIASIGRNSFLGRTLENNFGIRFVFDWKGAALASAVISFPLLVRPIRLAFEQVDDRLIQAARTLGASPWQAFATVGLPLARSGILAGSVLGFARSIGEFGATILIAGNIPGATQTISLLIYSRLEEPGGMTGSLRLVVASIAIALIALVVSERLDRSQKQRLQGGRL